MRFAIKSAPQSSVIMVMDMDMNRFIEDFLVILSLQFHHNHVSLPVQRGLPSQPALLIGCLVRQLPSGQCMTGD